MVGIWNIVYLDTKRPLSISSDKPIFAGIIDSVHFSSTFVEFNIQTLWKKTKHTKKGKEAESLEKSYSSNLCNKYLNKYHFETSSILALSKKWYSTYIKKLFSTVNLSFKIYSAGKLKWNDWKSIDGSEKNMIISSIQFHWNDNCHMYFENVLEVEHSSQIHWTQVASVCGS